MTPMAMPFPYPRSSAAETPLRWRLRSAAMVAAVIFGASSVQIKTSQPYADRGVVSTPVRSPGPGIVAVTSRRAREGGLAPAGRLLPTPRSRPA